MYRSEKKLLLDYLKDKEIIAVYHCEPWVYPYYTPATDADLKTLNFNASGEKYLVKVSAVDIFNGALEEAQHNAEEEYYKKIQNSDNAMVKLFKRAGKYDYRQEIEPKLQQIIDIIEDII